MELTLQSRADAFAHPAPPPRLDARHREIRLELAIRVADRQRRVTRLDEDFRPRPQRLLTLACAHLRLDDALGELRPRVFGLRRSRRFSRGLLNIPAYCLLAFELCDLGAKRLHRLIQLL